jgi:N-ethylmaleimide reductase
MKILAKTKIGNLELKNKMVMAPMTRSRTDELGVVPEVTALYYGQRAGAGLIISEAINISEQAIGLPYTPGIYTKHQIEAWKKVTDAVHKEDGKIFAQLWHTGRAGHSLNRDGELPVSASPIAIEGLEIFTPEGKKPYEVPRALSTEEVKQVIQDYKRAAQNAMEAGFDGVELQGGFGFLPNQFLSESSNTRIDEYGGSLENRSRFIIEVMQELINVVGDDRAGIKLSPSNTYHSMLESDPIAVYQYLFEQLNKLPIAYFHLMQPLFPADNLPHYAKDVLETYGKMVKKHIIINGGYDRETAETEIESDRAQFVSFGSLFLSNPDLPKRFALNAYLNEPDKATMYGGDHEGYTDYPFFTDK